MRDELAAFSRLWNQGQYFEAHEVLEDRWRRTGDPGERALIQCAAALLHLQRGNTRGAAKLLRAAAKPVRASAAQDRALLALATWVTEASEAFALDAETLLTGRPPLHLHVHQGEPGRRSDDAEGGAMRNPDVNETLDSWSILHRLYAFDRRRWAALPADRRAAVAREAQTCFAELAEAKDRDLAPVQVLGTKGDLLLVHYARNFEALAEAEMRVDTLALNDYLTPRSSYVSVLELGLYDASAKIHAQLRERDLTPYSPAWHQAFDELLAQQAEGAAARLWGKIPHRRYYCFYPMNKRRGEQINWYALSYEERQALMRDHGTIGRSYHGRVTQVISGSTGFDDWEWGVDLYADDPLTFKHLIYELRFDRASALYAEFGPFTTGLQFSVEELPAFLDASAVPRLRTQPATV